MGKDREGEGQEACVCQYMCFVDSCANVCIPLSVIVCAEVHVCVD